MLYLITTIQKRRLAGLLVLLIGLVQSPAQCAEMTKITLTTEHRPPFNYQNADGKIVGLSTDKIHEIFHIAGLDHSIELYPWARAFYMARTQPSTGIFTIIKTPERDELFQWVCPLQDPVKHYLYRLKNRTDIQINALDDIRKYKLGVTRKDFAHDYLQRRGFIEYRDYDITANDDINLNKLLVNRQDLVFASNYVVEDYAQRHKIDKSELVKAFHVPTERSNPRCLAMSLNTPKAVIEKLNQALALYNQLQQPTNKTTKPSTQQ